MRLFWAEMLTAKGWTEMPDTRTYDYKSLVAQLDAMRPEPGKFRIVSVVVCVEAIAGE